MRMSVGGFLVRDAREDGLERDGVLFVMLEVQVNREIELLTPKRSVLVHLRILEQVKCRHDRPILVPTGYDKCGVGGPFHKHQEDGRDNERNGASPICTVYVCV